MKTKPVTVRIDSDTEEQIDLLVEWADSFNPLSTITRSDILREALGRGLDQLTDKMERANQPTDK